MYKPKVSSALNKPLVLNVSANKAWTNLTTAYNTVGAVPNKVAKLAGKTEPFPEVEVDLATYSTEKALDGLFIKIAEEEKKAQLKAQREQRAKEVEDAFKLAAEAQKKANELLRVIDLVSPTL